jgi:hypothetical protein
LIVALRGKGEREEFDARVLEQLLAAPQGLSMSQLLEGIAKVALQPKEEQDATDERRAAGRTLASKALDPLLRRKWIAREAHVVLDLSEEEFFPSKPKVLNEEQRLSGSVWKKFTPRLPLNSLLPT